MVVAPLPEGAEELRRELGADRVALNRFVAGGEQFEVVGCTGWGFLAPGVRMSTAASTILTAARHGDYGRRTAGTATRLLDHVAVALGLRSSCSIPLRAGERVIGALSVMWRDERAPFADPARVAAAADAAALASLAAPPRPSVRALVCHEQELLARGLAATLRDHLGAETETCRSLGQALTAAALRPADLLLCSDKLSPDRSLAEVVAELRAAGATGPLLVVARTEDARSLQAALRAGAAGYLPAATSREQLLATALSLLDGHGVLGGAATKVPAPRLSAREREILRGVDRGLSDKQLAGELGVSLSTVKTHARRLYAKLGVNSRTAALHAARADGLL